MSEIEKMYENAGVKKEVIPCPAKYYGYDCTRNNWDDEDCLCDIEGYPPFTAEKQLFILKFFVDNKICGERPIIQFLWDDIGEQYYFYLQVPPDCYHAHDKDYDIVLAKVVNLVWTKLTLEQKQQIKEILE